MAYALLKFPVMVLDERGYEAMKLMPEKKEVDTSSLILAPMPGVLKSVSVDVGQMVSATSKQYSLQCQGYSSLFP